jgi:hypothetical protein
LPRCRIAALQQAQPVLGRCRERPEDHLASVHDEEDSRNDPLGLDRKRLAQGIEDRARDDNQQHAGVVPMARGRLCLHAAALTAGLIRTYTLDVATSRLALNSLYAHEASSSI